MICIGSIKDSITHEFTSGCWKAKILKPDEFNEVEVEFEKNGHIIFRKKFPSIEDAETRINIFFEKREEPSCKKYKEKKFNLKKARMYSGDPTMNYGPSTSPFSSENLHDYAPGGGLLRYMEPKTKTKNKRHNRVTDMQGEPSGSHDNAYNRSKYLYLEFRDDELGREGFEEAATPHGSHDSRNYKPPHPSGDFPLDVQDNPEEFKPNYTEEYGKVDTEQDHRARYLNNERKKQIKDQQNPNEEWSLVYVNDAGNEMSIGGLDLPMAVRFNASPKYRKSKIVKVK